MPDPGSLWALIGLLTTLMVWLLLPHKGDPPKYVFWYEEDVSKPKGESPPCSIECRWLPGVVWAVLTRADLQAALEAKRYEFIIVTPDKEKYHGPSDPDAR